MSHRGDIDDYRQLFVDDVPLLDTDEWMVIEPLLVENLENLWEQARKALQPGGVVLAQAQQFVIEQDTDLSRGQALPAHVLSSQCARALERAAGLFESLQPKLEGAHG